MLTLPTKKHIQSYECYQRFHICTVPRFSDWNNLFWWVLVLPTDVGSNTNSKDSSLIAVLTLKLDTREILLLLNLDSVFSS